MNIFERWSNRPQRVTILGGPFRGTRLFLMPSCSKRKIIGAYEHVLNPWLAAVTRRISVLWDVGAADGYYTYGCAHAISRRSRSGWVFAFDPAMHAHPLLKRTAELNVYRRITFEFVPRAVGASTTKETVTLNEMLEQRPDLSHEPALVKVDVEGAELEVLKGATRLLVAPHHWLVEVHADHLLEPALEIFRRAGRNVRVIHPRRHWLLGEENRSYPTPWIVTQ